MPKKVLKNEKKVMGYFRFFSQTGLFSAL